MLLTAASDGDGAAARPHGGGRIHSILPSLGFKSASGDAHCLACGLLSFPDGGTLFHISLGQSVNHKMNSVQLQI